MGWPVFTRPIERRLLEIMHLVVSRRNIIVSLWFTQSESDYISSGSRATQQSLLATDPVHLGSADSAMVAPPRLSEVNMLEVLKFLPTANPLHSSSKSKKTMKQSSAGKRHFNKKRQRKNKSRISKTRKFKNNNEPNQNLFSKKNRKRKY